MHDLLRALFLRQFSAPTLGSTMFFLMLGVFFLELHRINKITIERLRPWPWNNEELFLKWIEPALWTLAIYLVIELAIMIPTDPLTKLGTGVAIALFVDGTLFFSRKYLQYKAKKTTHLEESRV